MEIRKVDESLYASIAEYKNELIKTNSRFDGTGQLENYDDIQKWDLNAKLFESVDTLPPGYSLGFQYVYVDNGEVVGMINFRPLANEHPYLKQFGGHIGYNIKPSKRGLGIGSKMLKDFLPICRNEYYLDRVLITCNKSNLASRRVILNNNGIFEKEMYCPFEHENIERYWISIK